MASKVVDRGLQLIGDRMSAVAGAGAAIQVMSVDNGATAFAAGHTTLSSGSAPANEFDNVFDSTPTRAAQTVTHVTTLATGDYNNTVNRVALHNDTTGNVTASSATLVAGVDGLSLVKASTFTLKFSVTLAYTSS